MPRVYSVGTRFIASRKFCSEWRHMRIHPTEGSMTTNTNTRLLHGSLSEFGLVEILQMMELGSMTGAIYMKHATGRVGTVYFNDGKLANCSELDAAALTLGDVLQQLGM